MLKTLAIALVLLSGYLLFRELKCTWEMGVFQCEEFLRFIRHVKEKVTAYSSPSSEWGIGFHSDELLNCGFLSEGGFNTQKDYFLYDKRLFIPDKEREMLSSFFSEKSSLSLELEINRINGFELDFEESCLKLRDNVAKRVKSWGVIIASSALGIAILLL